MSHVAKQRALEAYAEGALSPRANGQLERHLARCAPCREALAQVRAYASLRADAHLALPPLASWERLAAALDAPAPASVSTAARSAPASGKLIALAWPLLAIAAALAIAWLGRMPPDPAPSARTAAREAPAARPASAPALVVGLVSLLSGEATLARGAGQDLLTLDSEVREGDLLRTGPNARLHVQLADGSGFALAPNTALRVARLRAGETELALAAGLVASQVNKLGAAEGYQVHVDDLSARVRGTRFIVARDDAPSVAVSEGRVEVARGDQVLAVLTPGQRYPAAQPAGAPLNEGVHLASVDPRLSVSLILPALPALRAFIVDGTAISAAGTLAMRLPPGPTVLRGEDLRGQIRSVKVDLTAPLTRLEPAALSGLYASKPEPVGYLSPEQIAKVVRAGLDPLRRCYERNLRFEPKLEGKLTAHMRVSAEGRVVRTQLEAPHTKLPLDLERCLELELQQLVFPKPEGGGGLSFELPLNLRSR